MPSKRRTRHRAARSSLACAVTTRWDIFSRLLKKTHMPTPIALSFAEGCAQSPRVNVPLMYASAQPVLSQPKDLFFARLASEIFLSGLQSGFFSKPLVMKRITNLGRLGENYG